MCQIISTEVRHLISKTTAMTMMADRENAARDIAAQLGISLSTLYAYVDAQGRPRARATEVLGKRVRASSATAKLV
jgi:hypothetical protein